MLTPPDGLPDRDLAAVLDEHWQMSAGNITYRPVGFGSHHWEVDDRVGHRWFLTVDDLDAKRHSPAEPLTVAFERLRGALSAAAALSDSGGAFVVAPTPTRVGEPVVRLNDRFAVAVYPYVRGHNFRWGHELAPSERQAVLDMVIQVHAAPAAVARLAPVDDFTIPHRGDLAEACRPTRAVPDCGPYSAPTAELLAENAPAVQRILDRYDELTRAVRPQASRHVLTHGEPHPGNVMRTADGWRLIDWDTALLATPERDLWLIEPGDGSVLDRYAATTGVRPSSDALDLYRLRWDIADLAVTVDGFRRPHTGTADDDASWSILRDLVGRLSRPAR